LPAHHASFLIAFGLSLLSHLFLVLGFSDQSWSEPTASLTQQSYRLIATREAPTGSISILYPSLPLATTPSAALSARTQADQLVFSAVDLSLPPTMEQDLVAKPVKRLLTPGLPIALESPQSEADVAIAIDVAASLAHNLPPVYPRLARQYGWSGTVLLRVQVDSRGHVNAVHIQRSSGRNILDRSALDAVQNWEFEPATKGKKPVDSEVVIPIQFMLTT
jgi:TonB family protein